jgi:hypothetical protein
MARCGAHSRGPVPSLVSGRTTEMLDGLARYRPRNRPVDRASMTSGRRQAPCATPSGSPPEHWRMPRKWLAGAGPVLVDWPGG